MNGVSRKIRLVCFSGIDGSGKTVHALETALFFKKSGRKCKYVWLGTPYFLSYPFMAICRLLNLTRRQDTASEFVFSQHQYHKNRAIAAIWPWIQFFDLLIHVLLRVYTAFHFNSVVVTDRFVRDTLVEVMIDTGDEKLYRRLVGSLMLGLEPSHKRIFFLDLDETLAFARRKDVPSIQHMIQRKRAYKLLNAYSNSGVKVVDATRPFVTVQEMILADLGSRSVHK